MKENKGICFDTNAFIRLEKGENLNGVDIFQEACYLPIICQGELLIGYYKEEGKHIYEKLYQVFSFQTLFLTKKTSEIYAKIFLYLYKRKRQINQNDLWIISLCYENNLKLSTFDKKLKECWEEVKNCFIVKCSKGNEKSKIY